MEKVSCLVLPVKLFFFALLLTVLVNEQLILSKIRKYPKLQLNLFYVYM